MRPLLFQDPCRFPPIAALKYEAYLAACSRSTYTAVSSYSVSFRQAAAAGAAGEGNSTATAPKPPSEAGRCKRPAGDWMRPTATQRHHKQPQLQHQHGSPPRQTALPGRAATRASRSDSDGSSCSNSSSGSGSVGSPPSPERNVLDNWRLPREGRDPSARPGVSAARRQAAAACVRVGSRVSFNTVVAAILIPSAKDLHAAARQELW